FPTRRSSDLGRHRRKRDRGLDLVRARRPARPRAYAVDLRQGTAAGDSGLRQGGDVLLPVGRGGGTAGAVRAPGAVLRVHPGRDRADAPGGVHAVHADRLPGVERGLDRSGFRLRPGDRSGAGPLERSTLQSRADRDRRGRALVHRGARAAADAAAARGAIRRKLNLRRAQRTAANPGRAPSDQPGPEPSAERLASQPRPVAAGRLGVMATEPAPISFARGAPSLDIIDVEGLRSAADRAFTNDPAGTFSYGTSVGYKPLRAWIADRHGVSEDQVLVTNGSMQADAFLFDTLVGDGDAVAVERPSYDRTLKSLGGRHADLHAIELTQDGVNVDELEALLEAGTTIKLAHLIPNFQNPAGYTLSAAKRERLVALARKHGFVIFEDDPYVELRFSGERLPTMLSLSTQGEVVYASSFSKTVCPGIRVGYLVGPADVIAKIAALATGTYI